MATGFRAEVSQPRASQPSHHRSRKQFTTYVESLTTSSGPTRAVTASRAARISIRWFVLARSAPESYVVLSTAQAQPPGPGLPEQAPSVKTDTASGRSGHRLLGRRRDHAQRPSTNAAMPAASRLRDASCR